MSAAAFIVIAIAFGISNMILLRRCAEPFPVRLISGLAIAFSTAAIQTLLYLLGFILGDLLRLESSSSATLFSHSNAYIMLGLFILVVIKMLFPYLRREPRLPVFNITDTKTVASMALASGINILLTGLGMGFVSTFIGNIHWAVWPMFLLSFVGGYLGVMFGRQKVTMRPRRWMIIACIMLIGTAIAAVMNA